MSSPATRVLTLLELLQSHRRLSGTEIADRLGVNRRTVRRYITALEDLGVPVVTEQGRYGGYMLVPGYKLPPMMFSDNEALAIFLGLLAARQLGLTQTTPAIDGAQAKLERVMPEDLKRRVRGVSATTKLVLARANPLLDEQVLLTLSRSIQAQQRVRFSYHAPVKGHSQRDADPYGLVFRYGNWYMSGYCHLRQDLRSFRLDRISNAQSLPHKFARPADFDAAEHFAASLLAMPGNAEVSVLLLADQETVSRTLFLHDCALERLQSHPQGTVVNTCTDNIHGFARWLSALPFPFRVLEPAALQQALKEHAKQLLRAC